MSKVSGTFLCFSLMDEGNEDTTPPAIVALNAWLAEEGKGQLKEITDAFGGPKHPQLLAYGNGFNFLDEKAFAEQVLAWPWREPENVILVIQPEDGPTRVYRPSLLKREFGLCYHGCT